MSRSVDGPGSASLSLMICQAISLYVAYVCATSDVSFNHSSYGFSMGPIGPWAMRVSPAIAIAEVTFADSSCHSLTDTCAIVNWYNYFINSETINLLLSNIVCHVPVIRIIIT